MNGKSNLESSKAENFHDCRVWRCKFLDPEIVKLAQISQMQLSCINRGE